MKKQIIFLLLFACLSINAQTLLVDDFKTGALSVFETSSDVPTMLAQSGTGILGNNRYVSTMSRVKYNQKMYVSVLPSAGLMIVSGGYGVSYRIELYYGKDAKGNSKPLNLDMTKYKNLNIEFDGIDNTLNFNVVAFSAGGRSQVGENLAAFYNPTYVYSIPVSKFSDAQCCKIEAFSPTAVNDLVFIFQPTTYRFGNDFAIKRIWFD